MTEKYMIVLRKDHKLKLLSKRKEFMDLIIKVLGGEDSEKATKDLYDRFGTKIVGTYNAGNSITVLNDGEVIYKD